MGTMKRQFVVMAGLVGLVFVFAVLSVWAQARPSLKITSPKSGADISGDTVTITYEATGVKIVPAADAKAKEEAHFHLFLDREDFKPGVEIPRDMEKEGIYHTAKTSHELKGLKPGKHKVTVVLSYNNHVPWEPLVTAAVTFNTSVKKKK